MQNVASIGAGLVGHDSAAMSAHYTHIEHDAKLKALNSMPDVTQ